ncbi:radical SAM protein [Streptomyces sp. NPDC001728]|uniref:B12-binding domain-containing radical SAM protein n=1 Tax=Streptomyces sp. NPDC001728 TaxID=3154396 RepID=UPI003322AE6B
MRALLLSGLGPSHKNSSYLRGSLFDETLHPHAEAVLARSGHPDLTLARLTVEHDGHHYPLLRPRRDAIPHLTTLTLESVLQAGGHDYVHQDLAEVWSGEAVAPAVDVDVVLLSTTYIWNRQMLATAMAWIRLRLPGVPVICGGQYTNLKFAAAMNDHPAILATVRGDGELALPALLTTLERRGDLAQIPNLVRRDGERIRINALAYIDLDGHSSPRFPGRRRIVPYESMRGCPFDCKFCSFPAASPKWRYKSAAKIRDDWAGYAEENGSSLVKAMDSTFTVPPTRLRELLEILPPLGLPWECYSRANVVSTPEFVDALQRAHCARLEIGFESMNEQTLRRMSKRVTARQNRRAFELLGASDMDYTMFFMAGYPGETPEQFEDTRRFLVEEFSGHFMLHLFSITDESMPLWADKDELRIRTDDPEDPDAPWSHTGMSSEEARSLQAGTLDLVRRRNDRAVLKLWQGEFEPPLVPTADLRTNLIVEKAVERLAMAPLDETDVSRGADRIREQLELLRAHGVRPVSSPSEKAA